MMLESDFHKRCFAEKNSRKLRFVMGMCFQLAMISAISVRGFRAQPENEYQSHLSRRNCTSSQSGSLKPSTHKHLQLALSTLPKSSLANQAIDASKASQKICSTNGPSQSQYHRQSRHQRVLYVVCGRLGFPRRFGTIGWKVSPGTRSVRLA